MKHLYKVLPVLFVLLCLGFPAAGWANDWDRSDQYRTFEPGEVRDNFPKADTRNLIGDDAGTSYVWQKATPRGGVWIDQIYRAFIEDMKIGDYTTPELSRTIFFYVNEGVDAGDIEAGKSYWIPADTNQPEAVQTAFAERLEQRQIARANAQPVTRGDLKGMLNNVTIELDGNPAAEAWVQRQAAKLLETQGGKILEEDLKALVATAVANQNFATQEDLGEVRDTVLDLATTVGGIRRDTTNRLSGVEAAQVAQGNTLKELAQAIDTIKDAQANQASTLTTQGERLDDQGARLGTVEITQAAQGVALQQQREILNGVVQQRELTMRWYDESWVMYTALALVAAVYLIGIALLQLSKASKKELRVEKGKAESATRTAGEAKAQAESAEKVAGEVKDQIGPMKDRIDQVEDDFHFLMELDSQERFDNPSLTAALVESLQLTTEPLKLRVKCLDGRNRYVHVFADVDEEGAPGMRFKGLKKGYDFVHKQNLIALRRHLKKAVLQDWVIGIQAARKVLEDA